MNQMITGAQTQAMAHATGDAELLRLWGEWVAQWERIELLRLEAFNLDIPIEEYVDTSRDPVQTDEEWHARCRQVDAWMAAREANGELAASRRWSDAFGPLLRIRRAMLRYQAGGPLGAGLQLATIFLPPRAVDGGEDGMVEYAQRPGVFGALRSLSKLSGVDLIAQLPKTIAPV